MNTQYYTFVQTPVRGRYEIAPWVIIEARNPGEANTLAMELGVYFDGCRSGQDCLCCGDRWTRVTDCQARPRPAIYGDSDFVRIANRTERVIPGRVAIIIRNLSGKTQFFHKLDQVKTTKKEPELLLA